MTKPTCHHCGGKVVKRVKLFNPMPEDGHVCYRWGYLCKRCREEDAEMAEPWPQGEDGRFLPSQECEVA